MKPGRELDALIAEKVMEWTWYVYAENHQQHILAPDATTANTLRWGCDALDLVPHYSTDIAAAWTLIEKLHEDRTKTWARIIEITLVYPGYVEVEVSSEIAPNSGVFDRTDIVAATTAPHAICLAALKAVGIDIDAEPDR